MQGLILGGIAAAICWVAWQRHNRLLDEQAEESGVELQPIKPGFDYEAAREQADRMEDNLRQYEQCNRLLDDAVVAIQSGEDMPLELTYFDHVGDKHRAAFTSVPPEIISDFARQLLDVCTVWCSSPLQKELMQERAKNQNRGGTA
jgi:hypothetical protein